MEYIMKELRKKFKTRAVVLLAFLGLEGVLWQYVGSWALILVPLYVLIDEYIKEGYFFKSSDVENERITHEKIFIVTLIASFLTIVRDKVLRRRREL